MNKRRLEDLMFEKHINQADLARAIGCTKSTLSRNINGLSEPRAETLTALANYLDVSVEYLMGTSDLKSKSVTQDEFSFALYEEVKDLSKEQKNAVLDMVKIFKASVNK